MSLDIIHPRGGRHDPEAGFVERWADRKARRAAERSGPDAAHTAMVARIGARRLGKGGRPSKHSAELRATVLLAYGRESAEVLARRLGISAGTVASIWARGRQDGLIEPLFALQGRRAGHVGLRFADGVAARLARVPSVDGRA